MRYIKHGSRKIQSAKEYFKKTLLIKIYIYKENCRIVKQQAILINHVAAIFPPCVAQGPA